MAIKINLGEAVKKNFPGFAPSFVRKHRILLEGSRAEKVRALNYIREFIVTNLKRQKRNLEFQKYLTEKIGQEQDRILEAQKIVAKRSGVTVDERESAIYTWGFSKASLIFWKSELKSAEEYFPKPKAATLDALNLYVEHHEKLLESP